MPLAGRTRSTRLGAAALLSIGRFLPDGRQAPAALGGRTVLTALALSPLVGAAIGLLAAALLYVLRWLAGPEGSESLVPSGLTLLALALVTGGRQLEGLASTVDDLVRHHRAPAATERGRVARLGAPGVLTLVFVVLLEASSLALVLDNGWSTDALVLAIASGRVAAVLGCTAGVSRGQGSPDAPLAGVVPAPVTIAAVAVLLTLAAALGAVDEEAHPLHEMAAVAVGLGAAALLLRACTRRLGAPGASMLGALAESAVLAVLVVLAAAPAG